MTVTQKTSEGQTSSGFERAPRTSRARRLCSCAVVAAACAGFVLLLIQDHRAAASPAQSQGQQPTASQTLAAAQEPGRDFSKFTHTNAVHARLPCLLCHRRDTNAPRPVLPAGGGGHMPCAGCHAQQFADSASPICTICHTDAQSGALKPFPPLRSFGVRFDHSTHTRQSLRQGCATCHKPERRGVSLSIPSGAAGHATCFQCHTPRAQVSGRDISSCGTCHRIGSYSRTPETAAAYRVSFSHTAHTSKGLACAECHQVRAGAAQRRQATARSRSCTTRRLPRRAASVATTTSAPSASPTSGTARAATAAARGTFERDTFERPAQTRAGTVSEVDGSRKTSYFKSAFFIPSVHTRLSHG